PSVVPRPLFASQGALDIALSATALHIFTLIVLLFPLGQAQLHLGLAMGEIHACRNERQTSFLRLADETYDLTLVEQQLARPYRVVVETVRLLVLIDVGMQQEDLAVLDFGIGVLQIGPTVPE